MLEALSGAAQVQEFDQEEEKEIEEIKKKYKLDFS